VSGLQPRIPVWAGQELPAPRPAQGQKPETREPVPGMPLSGGFCELFSSAEAMPERSSGMAPRHPAQPSRHLMSLMRAAVVMALAPT
jgi:hypothetical protein